MNDNLIGNELVTCKYCGAFNTQFSLHCVKCGHDLKEEIKEEEPKKKNNKLVKIIIAVLLAVSIILGILWFILK